MLDFADHLRAWLRSAVTGETTPEADAAGVAIATLLEVARQRLVKG